MRPLQTWSKWCVKSHLNVILKSKEQLSPPPQQPNLKQISRFLVVQVYEVWLYQIWSIKCPHQEMAEVCSRERASLMTTTSLVAIVVTSH